MTSAARRLAAAVLTTAAAFASTALIGVVTAPPASAAPCGTSGGVSVVVDYGSLGGGVQSACVPDGAGQPASSLFAAAGFDLSYVQNEPGFVCRVDDLPSPSDEACVDTPPQDAYWGLWWSDGTSGTWTYSNYGVSSLHVPAGSYVGFAWQTGSRRTPGLAPSPHPTTSSASATPTVVAPSASPTRAGGGGGHGHGSATPKPSTSSTARPTVAPTTPPTSSSSTTSSTASSETVIPTLATSAPASATASPTASAAPTTAPSPTSSSPPALSSDPTNPASSPSSGPSVPSWLVVLVIGLLFLAATTVAVVRRRTGAQRP